MGVLTSTGSAGDCYDNAMAESFFATLECELIDRRAFQTQAEARMAIFEYLEGWYNPTTQRPRYRDSGRPGGVLRMAPVGGEGEVGEAGSGQWSSKMPLNRVGSLEQMVESEHCRISLPKETPTIATRSATVMRCSAYGVHSRCGPHGRWITLGDPFHRSASNDVVTSIIRSDCYRLERQFAGRVSHPLRDGAFPRHTVRNQEPS